MLYLFNNIVEYIWYVLFLATQVPSTEETTTGTMVIELQLNLHSDNEIGTKDPLEKGKHLYWYWCYGQYNQFNVRWNALWYDTPILLNR